jgi:uncharacterized protein (TIGR03086 family)
MSAIADRYRKLAAGFTARVEAVPEDQWSSQSPCDDWRARDIVRHVVDTSGMFLGFIGQEPPGGPSVDDDPAGAWTAARDAIQTALDDPAVATLEYDGQLGRSTFEASVDRFLSTDALVHTWDLARAVGLDERLDPDEVRASLEATAAMEKEFGEMMRNSGAFGAQVDAPDDADEQTRLLAFLGRKV